MTASRRLFEGLEERLLLDTVTDTFHFESDVPPGGGGQTITVDQFDDIGGLLHVTKITIEITGTSEGGGTALENESPATGEATVSIGTEFRIERDSQDHGDGDWDMVLVPQETIADYPIAADSDGAPDYAYPNDDDSVVVTGTISSDAETIEYTDPADLADFIGGGTITWYFETEAINSSSDTIAGNVQTIAVAPARYAVDGTITVEFFPPEMHLTKGIVATNGQGNFTQAIGPRVFPANLIGTGGLRWIGGTISSDDLVAVPIESNLTNASQGDIVTYAIVIENRGAGAEEGVYDVRFFDTPAPGMAVPGGGINLVIADGTGQLLAENVHYQVLGGGLFDPAGGIEIIDPGTTADPEGGIDYRDPNDPNNGRNLIVIMYDMQVDVRMEGQFLVNTATLYHASATEGGADFIEPDMTNPASITGDEEEFFYATDIFARAGVWEEIERPKALVFQPFYSGTAEPGATLAIEIYDPQGNLIGSEATMVDAGGNWIASFRTTYVEDEPYRIVIRQTYPGHSPLADAGYNLRKYFTPAILGGTFVSEHLTVENVLGKRAVANAVDSLYAASVYPIVMGWHAYSFEFLGTPAVPSGL